MSTGDGGREWDSLQWDVTCANDPVANVTLLQNYLNTYHASTKSRIIIPNLKLYRWYPYYISCTLVKFSMTATNFLGQTSVTTTASSISMEKRAPIVSVAYAKRVYPWQTATFYATGSVSTCQETDVSEDLAYTWIVYDGNIKLDVLSHPSRDPRTLIIPAYTLSPNKVYSVQTIVSLVSAQAVLSSVMSHFEVLQSDLVVGIVGGKERNVSSIERVVLDGATGSYDPDNTNRGVQVTNFAYRWSCVEDYPNLGLFTASLSPLSF